MKEAVDIASLTGLVCAAAIDLETGEVVERFGDAARVDAIAEELRERARAMCDASGAPDDVVFTTPERFHLFVYDTTRSRVLYAEADRESANVAMTRFALEAIASA